MLGAAGSFGMYSLTALARRATSEMGPSVGRAGGRVYSARRRGSKDASTSVGQVSGSTCEVMERRAHARVAQRSFIAEQLPGLVAEQQH